jgi:hypothetical protein
VAGVDGPDLRSEGGDVSKLSMEDLMGLLTGLR